MIKCLHIKKDINTITFATENLWTQFYFESILCSWVCEFWIKINNWFYGFADTSFCTNIRKQLIIWDTIKICSYTRKWKWKTKKILSILGAHYHQQPDFKKNHKSRFEKNPSEMTLFNECCDEIKIEVKSWVSILNLPSIKWPLA